MKILYIANIRLPTEKAHGVQIMEMCHAFRKSGVDIELVIPNRKNSINEDPFTYYDIPNDFVITRLPTLNITGHSRLGFYIQSVTFLLTTMWYLRKKTYDVIYSRDAAILSFIPSPINLFQFAF